MLSKAAEALQWR